jgi:hypothetical protein
VHQNRFSFPMKDEDDMTNETLKSFTEFSWNLRQNFAVKDSFYFSQILSFHVFLQ